MTRPVLLDLFSGAGGAAMGYHRAGFDVIGVDVKPQPRYPFPFFQWNAIDTLNDLLSGYAIGNHALGDIAAIHASPPCQDHVRAPGAAAKHGTGWMLAATRDRLKETELPWVIENVPGAPMRADYRLCGCMFGLPFLKRERWFETSWGGFEMRPPCHHPEHPISVTGHGTPLHTWQRYGSVPLARAREVMGIDWMNRYELSQAIPPAYTEHIGARLLEQLAEEAVSCP